MEAASRHGSTCELEGLSEALAGVVRDLAVSRDHDHASGSISTSSTAKTGNRIHNQVVDAETGKEVPQEDRVKGYKVDRGQYVLLEEEELDEVALESTHTIDIEAFVPRDEVDEIYLDESFYLVPNDKVGVEAFAVIREAMREKNLVGLARVVSTGASGC